MLDVDLKLERSEEKFKMLFELSPVGMAMVDHETGEFLEVNQSLLNSTGYTKEEFLKLSFWDITPQEYESQEHQQMQDLNETGKFGPNEKEYIRKDGTRYPIKITGFSLTNVDGRKVVWGLIEDITQNKQYEMIYQDNKELLEYITTENCLENILHKIVTLAEERNPHSICSILLLDESKTRLLTGAAPSLPAFYNEAIHGVEIGEKVGSCGNAAYKNERVIVENIDTHENWQPYLELTTQANLHACWSEPIVSANNEVLGTFAIYNKVAKKPDAFELKVIETYANIASKAIEKYNYTKHLEQSEEQLEQLFNNSHSGLLYIDENRELIKANQRFADIMGYETPEEMIGFSMEAFHLSHERYIEFGKKNFTPLIQERENFNIEYELKRKDGSSIWCDMSGKAIDTSIPADLSKGVLWTVNDISLRIAYEKALEEKQILLKNILMTIPDMLWLKDAQGVYLACNPEFELFFGAKEEEIIGHTDYDFVDKELADFFRMHDKNAMNSDKVLVNEEWVSYAAIDKRVLLDTSKKAMLNEQGEVIGVLGIGHDVTQRKRKEEELKKLNMMTQSLTKSQQVLLSLFDKGDSVLFKWKNSEDEAIEYVSLSVEGLLGYSKKEFLEGSMHYDMCVHREDLPRFKEKMYSSMEKNLDYFRHEPYRVITKEGQEKWILDYVATQKDEHGNITYLIGYMTDITEQIRNQEMMYHQSKIASLGEMLGNISHQWRQPLSVISTTATGTRLRHEMDNLDQEELYHNLDNINEMAQYLSKTIDDFRNFFLSDTHTTKEVVLDKSLRKVIALIQDSFKSLNITIVKEFEKDIWFNCNENLLIQALINILNNAKDALIQQCEPYEKRLVFIKLFKEDEVIHILIQDNAKGIPNEYISKIFEPYFTTKHQSQGTGIGLYMTNQIITKHLKANIDVKNINYVYEDESYKGASFDIKIKDK